jgi:predicted metal-dependent enzyme (double-stranded beta helix superfamily)
MEPEVYPIAALAADLRRLRAEIADEHELLAAIRPLARRAALSRNSWFEERMNYPDAEQGFGVYRLHEEPDHSLAILAVSWLPHRGTPPHDHGTWGIVTGVDGLERNDFYRRLDDRSQPGYAELEFTASRVFGPGEVLTMSTGLIHSVRNDTNHLSLSLHIYGRHINYTGRSQFDLETRRETPFLLKLATE